MKRWLLAASLYAVCLSTAPAADRVTNAHASAARDLLTQSGVKGGLVVHLGCGDGKLTAALRASDAYRVHGLDTNADNVAAARRHIQSLGLYGPVSVDRWGGDRLPYVDNLVNLVVAERLDDGAMAEIMRVLCPEGVALVGSGSKRTKTVKPRPEEIDEWTHYLYDSTGNAVSRDTVVGPPRHFQWIGGPRWVRHHDHVPSFNAAVSAGGRLFYIIDEGSGASILLPSKWSLVARDAFNGTTLWKRPIPTWVNQLWPFKAGPGQLPRRLVAVGDRVFVTLGINAPVSMLDAATGATLRTFPETANTEEIVVSDGLLFVLVRQEANTWNKYRVEEPSSQKEKAKVHAKWAWDNKPSSILAVDPESGDVRWKQSRKVAPLTLAADSRRVYVHDGEKVVALNRTTGEQLWESAAVTRPSMIPVQYGPNLAVSGNVVMFGGVVGNTGPHKGEATMTALAADTGKTLWTAPMPRSGHFSAEDLFIIDGSVWAGALEFSARPGSGVFTQRDLQTGQVQHEFPPDVHIPGFHHRCHRAKATERYILTSCIGIEFVDTRSRKWTPQFWVRGICLYGIMPANGLIYAPPHYCMCFTTSKLTGLCALAPARGPKPASPGATDGDRLERGPASAAGAQPQASGSGDSADWPTFRYDATRSGASPAAVRPDAAPLWRTDIGGKLSAPVIADGKLFVAGIDAHAVHALDAASGKKVWSFTTGGRVDSPPTIHRGRVLFGSRDGWVYCLQASDGQLVWRFRAAPEERKMMAFEQLESVWPVHGSVLVQNDVLYCVAGRSAFTDGGMRLLRLDPMTGKKLGEVISNELDPKTGEKRQDSADKMRMPGTTLPDVLSGDGTNVFMRDAPVDFGRQPSTAADATAQAVPAIKRRLGFLDDTWLNRGGWSSGTRGWPSFTRICVFDDSGMYGFGYNRQYLQLKPFEHHLFAFNPKRTPRAPAARKPKAKPPTPPAPKGKKKARPKPSYVWSQPKLPLLVRAMVLAGETLFVAGPPDHGLAEDAQSYLKHLSAEVQVKAQQQAAALGGKQGGLLWAVAKADGKRLAEHKLGSPPVFDGMAAAGGRLYVCTMDGAVHCLGDPE